MVQFRASSDIAVWTGGLRSQALAADLRSRRRTIYASTPCSHFSGRVVDATGRAIEDATVTVPRHAMSARTDDGGRFRLPPLPTQEPTTLWVFANDRQQQYEIVQAGGRSAGVIIQFDQ